jgi:hypothetical protein
VMIFVDGELGEVPRLVLSLLHQLKSDEAGQEGIDLQRCIVIL